ncbi:hypothetical protein KQX54_008806 [Cotesia glomerata]|uniref:Uncharacterized protein n=1 Tax=Cotesia glomerata TaxID=32391 RepID=A0AAV7IH38_COTGL|nr:hypothetical protein KQX54_008806 [Cotesia glomerata]
MGGKNKKQITFDKVDESNDLLFQGAVSHEHGDDRISHSFWPTRTKDANRNRLVCCANTKLFRTEILIPDTTDALL